MEKPVEATTRQCTKCKQYRILNMFRPECKQCKQCLEYKSKYRANHKEHIRNYNKIYYQLHKEEITETRAKNKEVLAEKQDKYKHKFTECFYCKCPVHEYRLKRHNETWKHQQLMNEYHNAKNSSQKD